MKKVNPVIFKKVRSKINQNDVYYTCPQWDSKEVDGVTFLPIVKNTESKQIHYIRKDSLEYIK